MGGESGQATHGGRPPNRDGSAGTGSKKLYWHTTFGVIEVQEPLLVVAGRVQRPFAEAAGVHCRGYSLPLQRRIVAFGAEMAFGQVPARLWEHYGIKVPVSAVQAITEGQAARL